MFGLATTTEIRLALYGLVLAAIGGWLIYERVHLIDEGESRIKAQDATARAAQKAEDEKTSAGVVNDLKSRLAELAVREPPARPVPTLRLCYPTRYVRTEPATPGTQPTVAPTPGKGPSGVPEGTAGLDIGQPVSDIKRAAEVIAVYRDTTWDWALKQSR